MPQTAARCGSAADDVHTCVVSGWTLRHRCQQQLFVRCRWPHFAAPPPPDVSMCVADGRTVRQRRRRRLYMRRRRPRTAAPPPTDAIHTPQTAAHCDHAAANVHAHVADGRTVWQRRQQQPYARRR